MRHQGRGGRRAVPRRARLVQSPTPSPCPRRHTRCPPPISAWGRRPRELADLDPVVWPWSNIVGKPGSPVRQRGETGPLPACCSESGDEPGAIVRKGQTVDEARVQKQDSSVAHRIVVRSSGCPSPGLPAAAELSENILLDGRDSWWDARWLQRCGEAPRLLYARRTTVQGPPAQPSLSYLLLGRPLLVIKPVTVSNGAGDRSRFFFTGRKQGPSGRETLIGTLRQPPSGLSAAPSRLRDRPSTAIAPPLGARDASQAVKRLARGRPFLSEPQRDPCHRYAGVSRRASVECSG